MRSLAKEMLTSRASRIYRSSLLSRFLHFRPTKRHVFYLFTHCKSEGIIIELCIIKSAFSTDPLVFLILSIKQYNLSVWVFSLIGWNSKVNLLLHGISNPLVYNYFSLEGSLPFRMSTFFQCGRKMYLV